jgi:class 3 adenylate cyclase
MAETLLRCAEVAFQADEVRIVKSIGDAVMFTAPDILTAGTAAAKLLREASAAGLPPLRIGVAYGPMLRAYADYFGRTVNIASRLSAVGPSGEILLMRPEKPIREASWAARGLAARDGGRKRLRGVDERVHVMRITPLSGIGI